MRFHLKDVDLIKMNAYVIKIESLKVDFGMKDVEKFRALTKRLQEDSTLSIRRETAELFLGLYEGDMFTLGNKRMAWIAVVTFYRMNGYHVAFKDEDVLSMIREIESGEYSQKEKLDIIEKFLDNPEFILTDK